MKPNLEWDPALAVDARELSSKCSLEKQSLDMLSMNRYTANTTEMNGQVVSAAMHEWFGPVEKSGNAITDKIAPLGPTVWQETQLLGCGYSVCEPTLVLNLVCRYSTVEAQNYRRAGNDTGAGSKSSGAGGSVIGRRARRDADATTAAADGAGATTAAADGAGATTAAAEAGATTGAAVAGATTVATGSGAGGTTGAVGSGTGGTTAGGAGGAGGTNSSGGAGGTPAPTSASPFSLTVNMLVVVGGYTSATFLRPVFTAALAATLGIEAGRVAVTSVTDTTARRASSAVSVNTAVGYPAGTDTTAIMAAAAASAGTLAANLRAGGMTAATVASISPTLLGATPTPPTPPAITNAAAAAAGLLGGLLLVVVAALCFSRPAKAKPDPDAEAAAAGGGGGGGRPASPYGTSPYGAAPRASWPAPAPAADGRDNPLLWPGQSSFAPAQQAAPVQAPTKVGGYTVQADLIVINSSPARGGGDPALSGLG
jgi:hypothetical protein